MIDPKEPTWFESTFYQLPDVGQRQMGAIVGALIADAAVNGMDLSPYLDSEQQQQQSSSSNLNIDFEKFRTSSQFPTFFPTQMMQALNRSLHSKMSAAKNNNNNKGNQSSSNNNNMLSKRETSILSLYRCWSPASVAAIQVLNAIEDSKSVDSRDWVAGINIGMGKILVPSSSSSSSSSSFNNPKSLSNGSNNFTSPLNGGIASLPSMPVEVISSLTPANSSLFPLCSSIPIVALYPWARDLDVHENMKVVLSSIGEHSEKIHYRVCPEMMTMNSSSSENDQRQLKLVSGAIQHYLAGSSTLLRYLQSNPDPSKNTLLRLRGSNYGFDLLPRVDEDLTAKFGSMKFITTASENLAATSPSSSSSLPLVKVMHSAWNILRSDFYNPPSPQQFQKVIQRCVYETIHVHKARNPSHLACFVGACLGAKYGVRQLPIDWMTECDQRSQGGLTQVVSTVIPMTQWVWNPPE